MPAKKFCLNADNEVLKKQFEEDNFVVEAGEGRNDRCIIFFSGNGLYFPNEKEVFEQKVLQNDYYEWWRIGHSEEIVMQADKVIYVRDIYKQFYVNGINSRINSIEKLCGFMQRLTSGYRVITCGNSAGGYIATIVGTYLNAERVYNFGGQFTLQYLLKRKIEADFEDSYYFIKLYEKDDAYARFFNIASLIQSSSVPIIYFYSALFEGDKEQVDYLQSFDGINNVMIFAMKSEYHGSLMYNNCYKRVLTFDEEQLISLKKKYENKLISLRRWCIDVLDKKEAVTEIKKDIIRCHKSLQIIFNNR